MNRKPRKRVARSVLEAGCRNAAANRIRHRGKGAATAFYDRAFAGCRTKSVYLTAEEAISAALRLSVELGPRKVYRCPDCGKWHIATPKPETLEIGERA